VTIESRADGNFKFNAKTVDGEAKAPSDYEFTELQHEFTASG